jgi:hypothetical protein
MRGRLLPFWTAANHASVPDHALSASMEIAPSLEREPNAEAVHPLLHAEGLDAWAMVRGPFSDRRRQRRSSAVPFSAAVRPLSVSS